MDGKNLWNLRFVCWNNMSLLGHALKHACVISWSLVPSFEMRISFWVSENFVHQMLYWSILCQRLFHVHFAFRVLCFCKKCTLKKNAIPAPIPSALSCVGHSRSPWLSGQSLRHQFSLVDYPIHAGLEARHRPWKPRSLVGEIARAVGGLEPWKKGPSISCWMVTVGLGWVLDMEWYG